MAHTRLFQCTVDWEGDNLNKDVDTAIGEIKNNLTGVLHNIGGEMIHDLQKHIQDDVYTPYTPKAYPRRKDHSIFGIALNDIKNFDVTVDRNIMEFSYTPMGFHAGKLKDVADPIALENMSASELEKPLKPKPVHGDKLINRIETGIGYDWKCDPGPRPFWSNFVNDENNGKMIRHFNRFVSGTKMTSYDYKFVRASHKDLSFSRMDMINYDEMTDVSDDDLPF